MAKRRFGLTKRRAAIIFAAGVLVGVAGYIVLDRMAQSRAEAALAKVERQLPANARLAYADLDASFISQSATLETVTFRMAGRQIRAETVTVADVGETGGGNLRAGEVTASGIAAERDNGFRMNAGTVVLTDLILAPGAGTLRSLGTASVDTLSLSHGDATVRVADLDLRGLTPRRLGRFDAGVVEINGLTDAAGSRDVLRGLRINGLDYAAVPPVGRLEGMDPARLAAMVQKLSYDALAIREAEVHRGGERRLALRGLESRRMDADPSARAWTSGVEGFALRVDSPQLKMAGVLDQNSMLRGRISGRQIYDSKAGTLALTGMDVRVARAGRLTGEIRLTGVPAGQNGRNALPDRTKLARAKLAKVDMTYRDNGIRDAALSALATRSGMSRETLIDRRLSALENAAADAPKDVRASVAALGRFVRNGGALRLRAEPPGGVPMSAALMRLTFKPIAAAQEFNLTLSRP